MKLVGELVAGEEPDPAAHAGSAGCGAGGERTAAEPDYFGTAGRGDEDEDAGRSEISGANFRGRCGTWQ